MKFSHNAGIHIMASRCWDDGSSGLGSYEGREVIGEIIKHYASRLTLEEASDLFLAYSRPSAIEEGADYRGTASED